VNEEKNLAAFDRACADSYKNKKPKKSRQKRHAFKGRLVNTTPSGMCFEVRDPVSKQVLQVWFPSMYVGKDKKKRWTVPESIWVNNVKEAKAAHSSVG
jgi:hypothetical protein